MKNRTWTIWFAMVLCAAPAMAQNWTAQTSGTSTELYAVSFVNDSLGWAAGCNGTVLRTTNGGTNWSARTGLCSGCALGVTFANERCGWAACDYGVILRTTDGGTNWTSQTVTNLGSLWALAFVDTLHGWAVGDAGAIAHTTNGGLTWTDQSVNTMMLLGVAATDTNHAWATGGSGVVYFTTNGGATWAHQDSGRAGIWSTLDFATDSIGWAVGSPGKIMKTTNAGGTWTLQNSGVTSNWFHGVAAVDTQNVWVVGATGVCARTTNGGTNWTHSTISSQNLNGVAFPDAYHGWTVGNSGAILHYYTPPPNTPPGEFARLLPADSDTIAVGEVVGDSVLFQWSASHDPDGDTITYVLRVDMALIDTNGVVTPDTSLWVHFPVLTSHLDDTYPVYWSVFARDGHDSTAASNHRGYFVLNELWGGNAAQPLTATVTAFSLNAYPNPFNPSTTLRFAVPKASQVSLDVFDMLGRTTEHLSLGMMQAGEHSIVWNCPACPSGMYFARMRVGGRTLNRELMLLK